MIRLYSILCVFLALSFESVFGCGSAGDRRLGIETSNDLSWAGTNSKIFANVYADGAWKAWRRLDNTAGNCDDFVQGNHDYFSDFSAYNSEWEAIALFNCGNDGLLIESIDYWTGTAMATTGLWKPGVMGPFPENCLYCNGVKDDVLDPPGTACDIAIDGDVEGCRGAVFGTAYTGTVFTGSLPGQPDCGEEEYGADPAPINPIEYNGNYGDYLNGDMANKYYEISFTNTQIILLCLVIILIGITAWITCINCKKASGKVVTFGHSDVEMA